MSGGRKRCNASRSHGTTVAVGGVRYSVYAVNIRDYVPAYGTLPGFYGWVREHGRKTGNCVTGVHASADEAVAAAKAKVRS